MAVTTQFAYRTLKGVGITEAAPVYQPLPGLKSIEGNCRCCVYSPCGRYFGWASNESVTVIDPDDGHIITSIDVSNVYELAFSPKGSFLITWERPSKDESGDAVKNLKVWRTVENISEGCEKTVMGRFVQKSQTGWNLQYTSDERYCARIVRNEVQFYESTNLASVWSKLRAENVVDFAISPGNNHSVAVFIPEINGQPAVIKIFNVPQFATPISQKKFFKGDKVQLKWNQLGTSLVVLAQTEVDKTGKSYYGETTLYVLSANGGFDSRITLDKEGPIHDVSWSPNSKDFGVVYGYMPSKTTIFNSRAIATHSFPLSPRNLVLFSPTGRFVLLAGFGNLAGQMDIYDLEKDYNKICTIEAGNPSVCEWSLDSKFILTATTSPRLRVDNGIRLWHVGGSLIYNQDMVELYNVTWRPQSADSISLSDVLTQVPTPHASALAYLGTVKTPSKPAGAYRPPGARGTSTPLHFKREDQGGLAYAIGNGHSHVNPSSFGRPRRQVPGAETVDSPHIGADGDENLSKAALKNKKKREAKKAKEAEAKASGIAVSAEQSFQNNGPECHVHHENLRSQSKVQHDIRLPSQQYQRNNGPRSEQSLTQHQYYDQHPEQAPVRNTVILPSFPNTTTNDLSVISPGSGSQYSKKLRALQKKIRAIEDLEMRLASGEKLEETQLKKIGTKLQVQAELLAMGNE